MLVFNEKGHIVPDSVQKITIQEFEQLFVKTDSIRELIYSELLAFNDLLQKRLQLNEIRYWLDGSFTTKTLHPNDLDLVVFIKFSDALDKNVLETLISQSKSSFLRLDIFVVLEYGLDHKKRFIFESDLAYWRTQFLTTRRNRHGNKFAKGCIELILKNQNG